MVVVLSQTIFLEVKRGTGLVIISLPMNNLSPYLQLLDTSYFIPLQQEAIPPRVLKNGARHNIPYPLFLFNYGKPPRVW
jgi:hypothetical protein